MNSALNFVLNKSGNVKKYVRKQNLKRNRDSSESYSSGDLPLLKWSKPAIDNEATNQESEKKSAMTSINVLASGVTGIQNTRDDKIAKETPSEIRNGGDDRNIVAKKLSSKKCGVCGQIVDSINWLEHIQREHKYIAWIQGQSPIDFNNIEVIHEHLNKISKKIGGLICHKCKVKLKIPKAFLRHVKHCHINENLNDALKGVCDSSNIEQSIEISHSVDTQTVAQDVSKTDKLQVLTCGVCQQKMQVSEWIDHIQKNHNYLAWKQGQRQIDLNDVKGVHTYLQKLSKELGGLTCSVCGLIRKFAKSYLQHTKFCNIEQETSVSSSFRVNNDKTLDSTPNVIIVDEKLRNEDVAIEIYHCEVCDEDVISSKWYKHIQKQHQYLAWKRGDTPINFDDTEKLHQHLHRISKETGGLKCSHCDFTRKYVKLYLDHIKTCGKSQDMSADDSQCNSTYNEMSKTNLSESDMCKMEIDEDDAARTVRCGVCDAEILSLDWFKHIEQHNYTAWKIGEDPIDLQNSDEVVNHLNMVIGEVGVFKCKNCGLRRKKVEQYLKHTAICTTTRQYSNIDSTRVSTIKEKDMVTCAVCSKNVSSKNWEEHSMRKHYNLTWIEGDTPIDLRNPHVVEKYLKIYKSKVNRLVCNICGLSRTSNMGFYAHILTCGKTVEEIESFKEECEKCQGKYLCIYRQQHMNGHRTSELNIERKRLSLEKKQDEKQVEIEIDSNGRRRAAEKARAVIHNYTSAQNKFTCSSCRFNTDCESELNNHECFDGSDSDESLDLNLCSSEESDNSYYDDYSSNDDNMDRIKKKKSSDSHSSTWKGLPFPVKQTKTYVRESDHDFCKLNFSQKDLFPEWKYSEYEAVSECQLPQYLPVLKESCQVKIENEEWTKYKLFEARFCSKQGFSVFLGGSPQCMCWAPPRDCLDSSPDDEYLAVSCHRGPDVPHIDYDELLEGSHLIQIWNFGTFQKSILPTLSVGIVHEYGTVWSMSWCPSGVREVSGRLGLLALACSNGSVYILVVPHPSTLPNRESPFYKLKPVAELKLCMSKESKVYQATNVDWSARSGHTVLSVGYASGDVALYDLKIDSPILRGEDNGITVLYPYYDEQMFNTPVTGVCLQSGGGSGDEVLGAASVTSLRVSARAGHVTPHHQQAQMSVSGAVFTPHWPSLLITTDVPSACQRLNELELSGSGRRMGGSSRRLRGCARCGLTASAAPPLLRLIRTHPVYAEVNSRAVAVINMTPLAATRKKEKANDDFAVKIEPFTYEKAIKKYGLQISVITNTENFRKPKPDESFVERFPLAEIPELAFCLGRWTHGWLAVGTHAGVMFVINTSWK